jgi:hypothetical protein
LVSTRIAPLKADVVLVLDHERQEAAQLVELALHVGVEQRLVALASAPERIALPFQVVGELECVLHLRGGVGEDFGIGIGRRAGHVAPVAGEVGHAPQHAHAAIAHLAGDHLADAADVELRLAQRRPLGRDVEVVEGKEGHAQQREQLEGGLGLLARLLHRIAARGMPWPQERLGPERIEPTPHEAVPVADGEAQMICHALAQNHALGPVPAVGDRLDAREVACRLLHGARAALLAKPPSGG